MTRPGKVIFITGTDTDVGKTVLSLLVMRALAGRDAVYLKPVQTGCVDPDADSDPAFLHRHLPGGLPAGMKPAECIHSLRPLPKAPLFAGSPVDFENLVDFIAGHAARHDTVVVEGAGGVLVPITADTTMLDLALATRSSILVAGRAGLGTINHTRLTFEAIAARGADCLGGVLLDPVDAVPETDRTENCKAIEVFSGKRIHGVIGRIHNLRQPEPRHLDCVLRLLAPFKD
ncbi:dethiobiotin synthase [Desulfomicrobium salsuginis]